MTATASIPRARRYLRNIVLGDGIREIARDEGVHASTVLRQVRRCEELRAAPAWELVFSLMEPAAQACPEGAHALSDETLDAFLGVDPDEVCGGLRAICRAGVRAAVAPGYDTAIVIVGHHPADTIRVPVIAALLIRGHLVIAENKGRVSLLRAAVVQRATNPDTSVTSPACIVQARPATGTQSRVLQMISSKAVNSLPEDMRRAAIDWIWLGVSRRDEANTRLAAGSLAPTLLTVLREYLVEGRGIEEIERENGWPPRSGKVLLRAALEQMRLDGQQTVQRLFNAS